MLITLAASFFNAGLPVWAGIAALLALLYTAIIDARTGFVPPWPLLAVALLLLGCYYMVAPAVLWGQLLAALIFAFVIYALNEIHFRLRGHDALGMGDAHWSFVAVLAFDWPSVLMAWGVGAWLALGWLGLKKLRRQPAGQVYFVPFLMIALLLVRLGRGWF